MNILIIGSGGHHKGAGSLLNSLVSIVKRAFPDAHLNLMSVTPNIDSKETGVRSFHCLELRSPTLATKLYAILSIFRCITWASLYGFFGANARFLIKKQELKLLQVYTKADIIVTCTGDCLTDDYISSISIGSLYLIFVGILLKRPTAIIASQIGPFSKSLRGWTLSFLTKYVLNKLSLLTVRDKISLNNLRDMGVDKPLIYLTADVAFLLEPAQPEKVIRKLSKEGIDVTLRPLVGINTSFLIWKYGFPASKDLKEKFDKYIEWVSRITDYIIEQFDATVILIPYVFGPGDEDDRKIARKVYQKVKYKSNTKLIKNEYSPGEMKAIIGQFDLLITTRMHPLIVGTSMHVPSIGIYYSFKVPQVMKMLGQKGRICPIWALDESIYRLIDTTYSNRDEIRIDLASKIKILQKHALRNAEILKSFCTRKGFLK